MKTKIIVLTTVFLSTLLISACSPDKFTDLGSGTDTGEPSLSTGCTADSTTVNLSAPLALSTGSLTENDTQTETTTTTVCNPDGSTTTTTTVTTIETETNTLTTGDDAGTDSGTDGGTDAGTDSGTDTGTTQTDNDGDGYYAESNDCDDNNSAINPGVAEVCNDGINNDCNDATDCELSGTIQLSQVDFDATNLTTEPDSSTLAAIKILGESEDGKFGYALASAGDLNSDGRPDFLVGAPTVASSTLTSTLSCYFFKDIDCDGDGTNDTYEDCDGDGINQTTLSSTSCDTNGDGTNDYTISSAEVDTGSTSTMTLNNDGTAYVVLSPSDWSTYTSNSVVQISTLVSENTAGRLTPTNDNDKYGSSLAGLGDVDGDGANDILVGAIGYFNSTERLYWVGRNDLYLGGTSFLTNLATGTIERTSANEFYHGESTADNAGYAVTALGDLNGDGLADYAMSSKRHSSSAGKVYVVFGHSDVTGTDFALGDLTTTSDSALSMKGFTISGVNSSDSVGTSLAATDINADGSPDLIIGAFGADIDSATSTNEGFVYVVFGPITGTSSDLNLADCPGTPGPFSCTKLIGSDAGMTIGTSVAAAGDVDHDGYQDFLVGGENYDGSSESTISQTGIAYLVFGSSDAATTWPALDSTTGLINSASLRSVAFTSTEDGEYLGSAVSSAGDFNGDGYDDILLGAKSSDGPGSARGAVYLFNGKASWDTSVAVTTADAVIFGDGDGSQLGYSLSAAGDVNDDGFDDFLVGAPFYDEGLSGAGVTYLIYGRGE